MVTREAMETALKTKIDSLLNKLEKGKEREEELKERTIANYRRAREEDLIVTDLEDKLKSLEDTLLKTETENDALKAKLLDTEAHFETEAEFNIVQAEDVKKMENEHTIKSEQLLDTMETTKTVNKTANNISDEILKLSKEVRHEEAQCQIDEERVCYLEKELDEVNAKLATAENNRENIQEKDEEMIERINSMQQKRDESEVKADELDMETKRLEQLLEDLTEKLTIMTAEQEEREIKIAEGRRRIAAEMKLAEEQLKRNTCHQAQSVVKKRK